AIADQGRALAGRPSLDGPGQLLPMVYALAGRDYRDVTTGSSNGRPTYTAGPGYDLVTGLGSPLADRLAADLSGVPLLGVPAVVVAQAGTPQGAVAGTAFAAPLRAVVRTASGNPVPGVAV